MKKHAILTSRNGLLLFGLTAFFLIGVAYLSILNAPFILDDIWGIRDNPNVGNPAMLFASPVSFLRALFIYLPFQVGGLDPFAYHVLNVMFHFGTVFFLFLVIRELFNERYAWFAAVLFAVHPILIESVTWISSLPTPQYSCFLLMSLYFYVKHNKTNKRSWYYASIGAFLISILSAEKAIVFPILLLVTELSFFSVKKNWKKTIPYFLIAIILGGLSISHIGGRVESFAQNFYLKREFYNPLVQLPYSISHYFQLIFFPRGLTIYHTDIVISTVEFGIRWAILIALIVLIGISYKRWRPIFYWLLFFLITLAPTLIPLNIVWMVAERYVYLATAGVIAAFAYPLSKLAEHKKYQIPVYVAIAVITLALLVRTLVRNNDWQDDDNLWIATVKVSPFSSSAHNNMGDYYVRHNDLENAIKEFTLAVKLKPDYGDAYHNLGLAYANSKDYKNAEKNYLKAVQLNPRLWQSHMNLGAIYLKWKNYQQARYHMEQALLYGPPNPEMSAALEKIKNGELK